MALVVAPKTTHMCCLSKYNYLLEKFSVGYFAFVDLLLRLQSGGLGSILLSLCELT